MFDLIVSGGTAVMPASTEAADIGVAGGKIAAIGAPGSLTAIGAARVVDAAGQIVIPGGIDPHIHGGMTTLLDFALCLPDMPLQQSIEQRQREWAGNAYCDYGFHLMLRGTQT